MAPHSFARTAVMAALACFALASHAQTADVNASASLTLSNLRYQLIDLTPQDAFTPSLQTEGFWLGIVNASGQPILDPNNPYGMNFISVNNHTDVSTAGQLPLSGQLQFSGQLADGSASIAGSGHQITLSATVTPSQLLSTTVSSTYVTEYQGTNTLTGESGVFTSQTTTTVTPSDGSRSATLGSVGTTPVSDSFMQLTLAPQSGIVISGETLASLSARPGLPDRTTSSPIDGDGIPGTDSPPTDATAFSGAVIADVYFTDSPHPHYIAGGETGITTSRSQLDLHAFGWGDTFTDGNAPLAEVGSPLALTDQQSWSVSIANPTNEARHMYLSLYLSSSVSYGKRSESTITELSFVPDSVVPEPATYALMGLGLAGIALVARRRQPV
jgi:hypothetical protein